MKIPAAAFLVLHAIWPCLLLGSIAPALAGVEEEPLAKAEDPASPSDTTGIEPGGFVNIGSFFLGYRWVSEDDGSKAVHFENGDSSLTLGIDILACPLPHRYHLHAQYLNEDDYYADAGYAYKDLLQFQDILVGIHHNLKHLNYQWPGDPPSLRYDERSPGDEYTVDFVSNLLSLRLKTPDYPFHAFLKHRHVERDGNIQQRFVLGYFGNLTKTAETRTIDWQADTVTLGTNSHLGPIEVEYQYDYAEFDPGGRNILYDYYPPAPFRAGDIYPHDVVPETESYANSLKMHTSYAGGVVASATLSNLEQQNNFSGTEAGVWKGAFDFRWLPDPVLGLYFKYRHKDLDLDQVDMMQLAGAVNVYSYGVRQGVSYDRDQFTLSARYKPLGRVTIIPSYDFSRTERRDVDAWEVLPEVTQANTFSLSAQSRLLDTLKVKGIYEYKYVDDPAYNTEPDTSNQVRLNAVYTPLPWLTAFVDYVFTETDRDNLRYMNTFPRLLLEGGTRNGRSDRLTTSLSCAISEKITLTGSWSYGRWEVEQDLAFASFIGAGLPFIDFGSPYSDQANTYSLALQYLFREDITLTSEIIHTVSSGSFVPDTAAVSPQLPGIFGDLDATETLFVLELAKKMPSDWELGVRFSGDIYDDSLRSEWDGELFVTTLTLRRYF